MPLVMNSTVISVSDEHEAQSVKTGNEKSVAHRLLFSVLHFLQKNKTKLIHSLKIGVALVSVSLLYLIDPLYDQVGENAMWAIMTVVVIFESSAGATLSKGLNRFIGTILGGGLGCLAAFLAQEVGGIGRAITIGITMLIFGTAASYSRLIPNFKKKYDYAAMIFILTFSLVVVSGHRSEKVLKLAAERLATIIIGFIVCVVTSLLVFPVWAGDELHSSIASKFNSLASSIEGSIGEYFKQIDESSNQDITNVDGYLSVLNSNSKDEILRNFAGWEPCHGKFGFSHPWKKYIQIGDLLREFAASIISLKECLQSPRQPSSMPQRLCIQEPCETVGSLLASSLRELGESITQMKRCRPGDIIVIKLKSTSLELKTLVSTSKLGSTVEDGDHGLAMASLVFQLMKMIDKVEVLAKEVDKLGDVAGIIYPIGVKPVKVFFEENDDSDMRPITKKPM